MSPVTSRGTIAYILAAHETANKSCLAKNLSTARPNSTSLSHLEISDDAVGVMSHTRFKFCSANT